MTKPVFRFAPSPNGRLHLGHAYSALLNDALARRFGGRLLLRIEDIDLGRCRPEFEAGIYDDLAWLGLEWEEPVRRQSEHLDDYAAASAALDRRGAVYPCFCSRKEIADTVGRIERETGRPWPRDPDGAVLYPGTCKALESREAARRIAAGEPHAWRIDMERALACMPGPLSERRSIGFIPKLEPTFGSDALGFRRFDRAGRVEPAPARPERWGDAVVVRKDVPTSYHLSVVVDDALQGVTHVVRGRDLEAATDLHVLLQALLGLPTPLYRHHDLVLDLGGDKLAKSRRSESLADLRARGWDAAQVRRRLGFPARPASEA